MVGLPSVQPALEGSQSSVPRVTCRRRSVLQASLFTSRFTKQTWGKGNNCQLSENQDSPFEESRNQLGANDSRVKYFHMVDLAQKQPSYLCASAWVSNILLMILTDYTECPLPFMAQQTKQNLFVQNQCNSLNKIFRFSEGC